jgi:uncharacterized protein involved in oxidation of intracellular sulfur
MKIGVIIHSNDPETVWNAFRFAAFAVKQGESAKVFLTGRGVEAESLDTDAFKVTEQMRAFAAAGGQILACGTCLKLRSREATALCPLSNMRTMLDIISESDKVLTF